MSAKRQAERLMRSLQLTAVSGALLWAIAAAALAGGVSFLSQGVVFTWLVPAAAMIAAAAAIHRSGPLKSPEQVALWIEQHQRGLRYAFVTAVELELAGKTLTPELLRAAEQADLDTVVRQSRGRALKPAAVTAAAMVGTLFLVHRFVPVAAARDLGSTTIVDSTVRNRLVSLTAYLTPPAYAGLEASRISEPDRLTALQGTAIRLLGAGSASGIQGSGVGDTLIARDTSNGWVIALVMPAEPTVLTLRDREYRRLITVIPRIDSIPEVVLRKPATDTTYQAVPSGPLVLEADATDDLGLGRGYWEFLITTGSGEQFETVTRTGGHVAFNRKREGNLRSSIRLDTMHLTPGSVINLRAIVFDANNLTGPGRGVSETRTIRIAAIIDSTGVAAEPAIPIDSMWMSQRLLNLRTDTLLLERRKISRTDFSSRSVGLSNAQEGIRGRVMAVVAVLEDDGVGGSAPTEDSKLLRQAADAMQEARFDLAVAEADSARPHMRRALAILDQIRNAKRYHIRGVLRPTPVDIATVRLTGSERGEPAPAGQRPSIELADRVIAARLARVAQTAEADPVAALDSLTFLQVQLLRDRADVAALLGNALTAVKQGTPIAAAIGPARRRLVAPAVRVQGSGEWSGGTAP